MDKDYGKEWVELAKECGHLSQDYKLLQNAG